MNIKNKLKLKKYQTQNFVNQYLQKTGYKYGHPYWSRKKILKSIIKNGVVGFESLYELFCDVVVVGRSLSESKPDVKDSNFVIIGDPTWYHTLIKDIEERRNKN